MSFQTHKTFVHPQNTSEDLFDEIWEFSVPPLTATTDTLMLQKVHNEIVKLIHMDQAVLSKFSEVTRSIYMMNRLNLSFY